MRGLFRTLVLTTIVAIIGAAPAHAAEVLRLDPLVEGALLGGFAAVRLGLPLIAPTPPSLTAPLRNPPGGLDRLAPLRLHSEFVAPSDWVRWGTLGVGLAAVAADGWMGDRLVVNAAIFAEAWLLNSALTDAAKQLALRGRPYAYSEPKGRPDDSSSFFSGHASSTAVAAFTAARLIDLQNDLSPSGRLGVYGSATVLSLGVGTLRVAAGLHFPTDVLAGAAVGAALGVIVPSLHRTSNLTVTGGAGPDGSAQLGLAGRF